MSTADDTHMLRALVLAERGLGLVEPNPMVGCVIVKGSRVVGEGYHRRFGGPHAEVDALRKAGAAAKGATVYVTLEPCCHSGKTPPCTDALIAAGVERVVVACRDPFPQVAGKGIAQLRRAGIEVTTGVCRKEAQALNAPFIKVQTAGLPYVIAKWAMTLDGAIATGRGESKWISNAKSRRLVHELRARMDAIVVGIGTVLADDPKLTARGVKLKRVARRVVIDPSLKIEPSAAVFTSSRQYPVTIVTSIEAMDRRADVVGELCGRGVDFMSVPIPPGARVSTCEILRDLFKKHAATNVLIEGGGRTLGHFFAEDMVDEAWVFIAPKVLGDPDALRPVIREGRDKPLVLKGAKSLRLVETREIAGDLFLRYLRAGAA